MEALKSEPFWSVQPSPAFCVKTRRLGSDGADEKGDKVFLNFCTCDELPAPRSINEDDLAAILESDDPGSYKIPISLGEAHEEVDKSATTCVAYDVIINKTFFDEKVKTSELFKAFLVLVAIDALNDKYALKVDKQNWVVLKNRRQMGDVKQQHIKQKARPMIVEIEPEEAGDSGRAKFTFVKDTIRNPTKILGTFELPGVKNAQEIEMNVGDDRIVLKTKVHYLDVCLPFSFRTDAMSAAFNVDTKILLIELPILTENTLQTSDMME